MKIRTKIPVIFNSGIKSQSSAIVEGIINMIIKDGERFNVSYKYVAEDGLELKSGSISLSNDEINGLYLLVAGDILSDLNYTDSTMYLFYLGMKIKMSETFGINVNDIEVIIEE